MVAHICQTMRTHAADYGVVFSWVAVGCRLGNLVNSAIHDGRRMDHDGKCAHSHYNIPTAFTWVES